jgi:Inorganic Pyrophosphatase
VSEHPGHRENPIEVISPRDLDNAVLRNWDPTRAQAEAGNYRKTHAIIGGGIHAPSGGRLHVAVETPLDRVRSGVGPDGAPWSVRMPCHYGYIKRTEGADGDGVDVYIGPESHVVHKYPVWIVDQVDAESGKFDEHKCLLAFKTADDAHRTYLSAFSDGKGQQRIGSAVRLSYSDFVTWIKDGDTKNPIAMKKSVRTEKAASAHDCGCRNNSCSCQSEGTGGSMPGVQPDSSNAVAGVGFLAKTIDTIWGSLTKAQRNDLMKDALASGGSSLFKAEELLNRDPPGGPIHMVEDTFDGRVDDTAEIVRRSGPDTEVPAGKVNTGPVQAASGEDAMRMERHYSRFAPQGGIEEAASELGRKVASMERMMKSMIASGKATQTAMSMILKSLGDSSETVSKSDIDAIVSKAVAKAVGKALPSILKSVASHTKTVVKAEDDKDDDKESGEDDEESDDDEDDEASESESGGENEIEIVNEIDDEEDDEDEEDEGKKAARKAAAQQRIIAKGLIRLARKAASEAEDAMKDDHMNAGKRHHEKARKRVEKARMRLDMAKSLRGGHMGASSKAIAKSIESVSKSLKKMRAANQDKWPSSSPAAKAAPAAAAAATAEAPAVSADEIKKAVVDLAAQIAKANAGYAVMQTNVEGLMRVIGGQSRGDGVNPSAELIKSQVDTAAAGSTDPGVIIGSMFQNGALTAAQRDRATDTLQWLKNPGLPESMREAHIMSCSAEVQPVLRQVKAA